MESWGGKGKPEEKGKSEKKIVEVKNFATSILPSHQGKKVKLRRKK
jgi:hypothetical protein